MPSLKASASATSLGRLHVLTDFYLQQRRSHAELAAQAIAGGADVIQFRQKHGGLRNKLAAARPVQTVCDETGVPLIVDDELPIMQAIGAAGVHLGQDDFPIDAARAVLGAKALIGATATTADQAAAAHAQGADYIGFGPVFPTHSKKKRASVKGLEGLAAACAAVPIPVIAIAGITAERIAAVLEAGAHGVAVLSTVALADAPQRATARLRTALDEALRQRA